MTHDLSLSPEEQRVYDKIFDQSRYVVMLRCMFWVLKRTISCRHFFSVSTTNVSVEK